MPELKKIRRSEATSSEEVKKAKERNDIISPLEDDLASEKIQIFDFNSHFKEANSNSVHKETNNSVITESLSNDSISFIRNEKCDCSKKFDIINDKLNEILSRISVMERAYIGNSHPSRIKSHLSQNMENSEETNTQLFLVSNRLPATNVNDLENFEKNLKDTAFRATAVSNLQ